MGRKNGEGKGEGEGEGEGKGMGKGNGCTYWFYSLLSTYLFYVYHTKYHQIQVIIITYFVG